MNTLSGALFFFAFLPYIWAIIINHQTAPSPVSWAIWASVNTLTFFAMKKEKAATGQIVGATIGAWIITVLALVFGKPTIELIEVCGIIIALAGVALWKRTDNPLLQIACAQIAMFAGAFATFAKAYANPAKEDPIAWSIWWVSCVCALFAIRKWNMANALQPLTFMTIETIMVFLVVIRPHLF